jgi:DnaJ-domain-containing protein 1
LAIVIKRAEASGRSSADLYRVLELRPEAGSETIKAAYRRLAKRFHPDVNAGHTAAERRFREINRAYRVLGDPEARAAYDLARAYQSAEARRRFWRSAAIGVATFLLTASFVPVALLLKQGPPSLRTRIAAAAVPPKDERVDANATADAQPGRDDVLSEPAVPPERETQTPREPKVAAQEEPAASEVVSLAPPDLNREQHQPPPAPAASPMPAPPASPTPEVARIKAAMWVPYRNARSGFALSYPADVFGSRGGEDDRDDRLLISKDGRALLRMTSMRNTRTSTLTEFRRLLIAERYADAAFDYMPVRDNWFVLSGSVGDEMFYERVTFSCDRRSIHGWLLVYPLAERLFFDDIVEQIHQSYRYDPGPGTRCGISAQMRTPNRSAKPDIADDVTQVEQDWDTR